jgi:hypothetical protein
MRPREVEADDVDVVLAESRRDGTTVAAPDVEDTRVSCQLPTTEVVGLSVDSLSAVESTEAWRSPFRFSVPDGSAH